MDEQTEVRFDRLDQRLDTILETLREHGGTLDRHTETLDRHSQVLDRHDDRLGQHSGTLDRLLVLAIDHAKELGEVKEHLRGVQTDFRQMRKAFDGVQDGFREHLTWHLGRQ